MGDTLSGMDLPSSGIILEFYKYVTNVVSTSNKKEKSFVIWGPFDFLLVYPINSLSHYQDPEIKVNGKKEEWTPIEKQSIFLYKDAETLNANNDSTGWIFNSDSAFPLIIISLIKTKDVSQLISALEIYSSDLKYNYDVFKTLGPESCVVAFRSNSYKEILHIIISISNICESSYSIIGVQNHKNYLMGSKDKDVTFSATDSLDDAVTSIRYVIKDGSPHTNRAKVTLEQINKIKRRFEKDFKIPNDSILLNLYYQFGQYDLEIQLEGKTRYLLEIMLNINYGLVNIMSSFYKKCIIESQTTWKSPLLI